MPNRDDSLDSIAGHVKILNKELGEVKINVAELKSSVKMLKWILGYIAVLISGLFIKLIMF